jgi:hypothetical protein
MAGGACGRPGRAGEDHPIHAAWVAQRELHRDHSAHRQAANVGLLDLERVHQRGGVVGHVRDRVRGGGLRAAARVAVVEDDDLKLAGQRRNLRERPKGGVVSDPHHQHQRLPLAVHFVVELLAVCTGGT